MDGEDCITTLEELWLYDGQDEEETNILKEPFMLQRDYEMWRQSSRKLLSLPLEEQE
jgi:hypothetical protein